MNKKLILIIVSVLLLIAFAALLAYGLTEVYYYNNPEVEIHISATKNSDIDMVILSYNERSRFGMDPEKADGEKTLFKLTGDGVMATTGDYYEARYRDRFYNAAILDNDLHVTFSSQSAKLEAARNCSYYYESGPYIGLVDKNGSWLIKLLPYAE